MDKYSGQAGTFVVQNGERVPVTPDEAGMVKIGEQELHRPATRPHEDGDAPRDASGKRVDRGADHVAAAKPQPAMPEPAATPPWATPDTDKKETT